MKITKIALIFTFLALCLTVAFAQNSSVVPASAGSPGGSTTQFQYNSSSAFAGSDAITQFANPGGAIMEGFGSPSIYIGSSVYPVFVPVAGVGASGQFGTPGVGTVYGGWWLSSGPKAYFVDSAQGYAWGSTTGYTRVFDIGTDTDTAVFRNAAGVVEANNGTKGTLREYIGRSYIHGGTAPAGSGNCAIDTQVGGNTAGTFQANGACVADTIILTFGKTAPAGWACFTTNRTAVARILPQTASSTTTATFTGSLTDNDVVQFACSAY